MNTKWRYLGRRSGHIFEIYRFPDIGKPFYDPQVRYNVQRLKKNGDWIYDPNDRGIWNEMLKGDFDESNEITEDEAMRLINLWSKSSWPGRE